MNTTAEENGIIKKGQIITISDYIEQDYVYLVGVFVALKDFDFDKEYLGGKYLKIKKDNDAYDASVVAEYLIEKKLVESIDTFNVDIYERDYSASIDNFSLNH